MIVTCFKHHARVAQQEIPSRIPAEDSFRNFIWWFLQKKILKVPPQIPSEDSSRSWLHLSNILKILSDGSFKKSFRGFLQEFIQRIHSGNFLVIFSGFLSGITLETGCICRLVKKNRVFLQEFILRIPQRILSSSENSFRGFQHKFLLEIPLVNSSEDISRNPSGGSSTNNCFVFLYGFFYVKISRRISSDVQWRVFFWSSWDSKRKLLKVSKKNSWKIPRRNFWKIPRKKNASVSFTGNQKELLKDFWIELLGDFQKKILKSSHEELLEYYQTENKQKKKKKKSKSVPEESTAGFPKGPGCLPKGTLGADFWTSVNEDFWRKSSQSFWRHPQTFLWVSSMQRC